MLRTRSNMSTRSWKWRDVGTVVIWFVPVVVYIVVDVTTKLLGNAGDELRGP